MDNILALVLDWLSPAEFTGRAARPSIETDMRRDDLVEQVHEIVVCEFVSGESVVPTQS